MFIGGNNVAANGNAVNVMLPAGTHTCTLTVTDTYASSHTDSTTITVSQEPNQTPVANAGSDATLTVPHDGIASTVDHLVQLDGSASADGDNDELVGNCYSLSVLRSVVMIDI